MAEQERPPLWRVMQLMKGAVPTGVYTRGPRKGRPKWPPDSDLDVLIVEFKAFRKWVNQQRAEVGG